jgi:hypothetical protein
VNKKKQKNFNNFWPVALERLREAEQKFFGSFFQKRTPCFYSLSLFLDGLGITEKEPKRLLLPFGRVSHCPLAHQKINVFCFFLFTKRSAFLPLVTFIYQRFMAR